MNCCVDKFGVGYLMLNVRSFIITDTVRWRVTGPTGVVADT